MLNYIPTASLIQHEWKTHGTCSGLSAADYFAAVRKARDSVTIPDEFRAPAQTLKLSPAAIEQAFATSNPSFPKTAFRTSCTGRRLAGSAHLFRQRYRAASVHAERGRMHHAGDERAAGTVGAFLAKVKARHEELEKPY